MRTFTATAGQKLTIHVSGNTFSGGVDLTVRRPERARRSASMVFVDDATGSRTCSRCR